MSRQTRRRRTARRPHPRLPRPPLHLAVLLAAALLLPAVADGQYFGRNKVLWEDFPFHTGTTEHFDLYYYPADHAAADDLARMAERWHSRLTAAMDHQLAGRKPLIFYADQPDFRQTTVARGLIGEGVGGFTEPLRNRMVMPLAGSLAETDHVLGHELVHVFQFDLANQLAALGRNANLAQIPLWMVEGMAEYYSKGREDPLTAMWLRDAVADDRLPNLNQLNRGGEYNPYRWGQAFYAYVAGRWNDRTVTRLFGTALLIGPRRAIEEVLGESPDDVFADWHQAVRGAYQPILAARHEAGERAELRIGEDTLAGRLNVSPSLSPDGRRIAFLSTRDLFSLDLYVADAATGEVQRRLASGRGNPHFDSLRFLDSAGAWSPDGRRFAFTVFAEGDNALAVVDAGSGRVVQRYAPPVGSMSNPAWSPDGRTIAFSGSIDGLTDLWLLDVESGEARRLTDDAYTDVQPAFSADGRTLAFATDRGPGTDLEQLSFSPLKIGLYDLETGNVQVLDLFAGARHLDPQFSPDGRHLYFLADPDGVSDLYRLELAGGRVTRLTELKTGISGITYESPALSVAAASGDVAFSVYRDSRYSIYTLAAEPVSATVDPRAPLERSAALLPPLPGQLGQPGADTVSLYLNRPEAGLPPSVELESRPYESRLGLAYVGPPAIGVGVDRYGFGVGGSVAAYFTDVLNRHQVGVAIQGGNAGGGVGTTIGGQVSYLNQTDRLAWGADAAHLPFVSARTAVGRTRVDVGGELVPADVVRQVREITTIDEVSGVAHYPLSATRRWEASAGATWYSFDREVEEVVLIGNQVVDRREGDLDAPEDLSLYRGAVAFVGDSSIYGFASPVAGTRYRLQVETYGGDLAFQTALADYRRYFLRRPMTFAVRGIHYGRYGDDAETGRLAPLYLGNETWVRGYAVGDFDLDECTPVADSSACPEFDRLVGSRVGLVNLELRVPLFGIEGYGLFEVPWAPTELVLFADAGAAWDEGDTPDLRFDEETVERVPVVSAGLAARIVLGGYLPIELYYAHPFQRPETDWQFGFLIAPGW